MSNVKIFEIAGSIAGVAGISLTVFFFLFQTIIKSILPSLTRRSKQNIVVLMLFMVWSVTIIGMTSWIYANTQNDGGKQPTIELDTIAQKEEISKATMRSAFAFADEADFADEKMPQPTATNGCNLNVTAALWLSFNKERPYFQAFEKDAIKVFLLDFDPNQHKATFRIELKTAKGKDSNLFTLAKGQSFNFDFEDCNYRLTFTAWDAWTTSIQYWFKTRYEVHFAILPSIAENS